MHRATPKATSFVGWSAGGARALIGKIQDQFGMQTMSGTFNRGEKKDPNQQGEGLEAPQNYGNTSVPMEAEMGKDGQIEKCAETFINFLGGNRSFPIAGPTDDRRHRLKKLNPGDVAMFDHLQQQFHFNKKGSFLTGVTGKVIRMALAEVKKQKGGGQGGSGAQPRMRTLAIGVAVGAPTWESTVGIETRETGTGTGGQGGDTATRGQAAAQPAELGQQARADSTSTQYNEVGPEKTESVNKEHRITLQDKEIGVQIVDGSVYLGGLKDKHQFAKVKTVSGPSMNVYARIG